jgi:hypothetical protein
VCSYGVVVFSIKQLQRMVHEKASLARSSVCDLSTVSIYGCVCAADVQEHPLHEVPA